MLFQKKNIGALKEKSRHGVLVGSENEDDLAVLMGTGGWKTTPRAWESRLKSGSLFPVVKGFTHSSGMFPFTGRPYLSAIHTEFGEASGAERTLPGRTGSRWGRVPGSFGCARTCPVIPVHSSQSAQSRILPRLSVRSSGEQVNDAFAGPTPESPGPANEIWEQLFPRRKKRDALPQLSCNILLVTGFLYFHPWNATRHANMLRGPLHSDVPVICGPHKSSRQCSSVLFSGPRRPRCLRAPDRIPFADRRRRSILIR